jgi:hypothetical protein
MMTIAVYRVRPDGTRVHVLPRTTVAPRDPERPPPPLSFPPCRCARCLPPRRVGEPPSPARPFSPPTPILARELAKGAKELDRETALDRADEAAKDAASARAVIDAET